MIPSTELEIIPISIIGELPGCLMQNFVIDAKADLQTEITRAATRYQVKTGKPAQRVYVLGQRLFVTGSEK